MSQEECNQYGATRDGIDRYARAFNESEVLGMFGIEIQFPDLETVEAVIDEARPGHMGGLGDHQAINGGVLAALYDLVLGCSAALVDPRRRSATVQLSMNFERPVLGSEVRARAKVDRAGRTLVFSSAEILDGRGEVCSRATGVVRISQKLWVGDGPADHPSQKDQV